MSELTPQKYLSTADAAKIADCTPGYIEKLCRQGYLPGTRQGSSWLVSESDLTSYLSSVEKERLVRREELARIREQEYRAHQPFARRQLSSISTFTRSHAATLLLFVAAGSLLASANFVGQSASLEGVHSSPSEVAAESVSHTSGQSAFGASSGRQMVASVLNSLSESNVPFASNIASFFGRVLAFFTGGETATLAVVPVAFPQAQPDVVAVSVPASEPVSQAVVVSENPQTIVQNIYPTTYITNEGTSKSYVDFELARLSYIFNRNLDNIPSRASRRVGPVVGTEVSATSLSLSGDASIAGLLTVTNMGVGTSSPDSTLSVQGNALFSGDLRIANLTATGTASIGTLTLASALTVPNGGTGSTTLSGILAGNGTSGIQSAVIGSGLSWDGTTLTSISGTVASGLAGQFPYYATDGSVITATSSIFLAASGNVGIGTSSPTSNLSIESAASASQSLLANSGAALLTLTSYRNSAVTHAGIEGLGARGTSASPSVVQSGDALLSLRSGGWDGTSFYTSGFDNSAAIDLVADENFTSGLNHAGKIVFYTMASGDNYKSNRMVIGSGGNVGIGSTSPYAKLSIKGAGSTTGVNFQTTNSSNSPLFTILDSGNVGIGTTNPGAVLDVAGNIRVNASGQHIQLWNDNVGLARASNNLILGGYGGIDFKSSNTSGIENQTTRMFIDAATGNVGIGTTTPAAQLQLTTPAGSVSMRYAQSGGTSRNVDITLGTGIGGYGGVSLGSTANANSVAYGWRTQASGNYEFLIDQGGNVGIGTTSPFAKLSIGGDIAVTGRYFDSSSSAGTNGMVLTSTGTGTAFVATSSLGFATGSGDAFVQGGNSFGTTALLGTNDAQSLAFETNGTAKMTILSGGNVGIGSTSPVSLLSVGGSGELATLGDTSGTTYMSFARGALAGGRASFGYNAATSNAFVQSASGKGIEFNVNNNTVGSGQAMVITSVGNVGIGTTSPVSLLHVESALPIFTLQDNDETGNIDTYMQFRGSDNGQKGLIGFNNSNNLSISNLYGNDIIFSTNASEKMRILSNGNVGIGTTTPTSQLHIEKNTNATYNAGLVYNANAGTSAVSLFTFTNDTSSAGLYRNSSTRTTDGGTGVFGLYNDGGGIRIRGNGDTTFAYGTFPGTDAMTIKNTTGNVGIGTTSPSVLLTVGTQNTGTALDSNEVFQFGGGSSVYGTIRNATNKLYVGLVPTEGFIGTQTSLPFAIRTGGSNRLTVDTSGNIGLGTGTPNALFDISSSNPIFRLSDTDGGYATISGNSAHLTFSADPGATQAGTRIAFEIDGTEKLRLSTNGGLSLGASYVGTDPGAGSMIVSGNVGIGTTTPWTKFGVTGTGILANLYASSGGYAALKLNDSTSVAGGTDLIGIGDAFAINTAGQERLRITNNGNVGIGTTTPSALLALSIGTTGDGILVAGDKPSLTLNNTNSGRSWALKSGVSGLSSTLVLANNGTDQFFFNANGRLGIGNSSPAQALDITGTALISGNLGIGTTSPSSQLTIASGPHAIEMNPASIKYTYSGAARYELRSDGTGTHWAGLYLDAGNAAIGTPINGSSVLNFSTGGTERMRISSSGNVGIGTTTPGTALSVAGTGTFDQIIDSGLTADTLIYANGSKQLSSVTLGNALTLTSGTLAVSTSSLASGFFLQGGNSFGTTATLGTNDAQNLVFETGGSPRMTFDTSGNAGLGITAPNRTLSINGTLGFAESNGSSIWHLSSVSNALTFTKSGSFDAMTIGSTGNVGIGTTSPMQALYVSSTNNAGGIYSDGTTNPSFTLLTSGTIRGLFGAVTSAGAYSTDSAIGDIAYQTKGGKLLFNTNSGGGASTLALSGGNVGIGTTSPSQKLDVNGGIAGDFVTFPRSDSLTGLMYISSRPYTSLAAAGARTNDLIFSLSGGGSIGEAMRITTGGNVGIGTTSPQTNVKLDVHGRLVAGLAHVGESALTTSAGEFWLPSKSLVTIGESSAGDANPAITLYRTSAGYSSGRGVRIYSPTSAGVMQFQISAAGGTYGTETYNTAMQIVSAGYVNIATTTVQSMLAVQGTGGANLFDLYGTAGANRFTVTNGGNVGIGTTSPTAKFSIGVAGDPLSGITSDGSYIAFNYQGDTRYKLASNGYGELGLPSGFDGGALLLESGTSGRSAISGGASGVGKLSFFTNNNLTAAGMTLTGTGLGVGVTAPDAKLEIGGAEAADEARIIFAASDASNRFTIETDLDGTTSNDMLGFRSTLADNILVLRGSGNVGIGTNSPTSLLYLSSDTPVLTLSNASTTSFHGIEFRSGSSLDASIKQQPNTGEFRFDVGRNASWGGRMTFYTDTVERMRITNTGNVGIGTASPGAKLHVYQGGSSATVNSNANGFAIENSGNVGMSLLGGTSAYAQLFFGDSASNNRGQIGYGLSNTAATADRDAMFFSTNGTERMRINSTGNVGIGSVSPDGKLHLSGTTAAPARLVFERSDGGSGAKDWVQYVNAQHNFLIGEADDSGTLTSQYFTVADGGNVGIGTTSPVSKLAVEGTSNILTMSGTSANAANYINFLSLGGSSARNDWRLGTGIGVDDGFEIYDATAGGPLMRFTRSSAGASTGTLNFYTNAATARLTIDTSGNVGIGTTTPNARLNVYIGPAGVAPTANTSLALESNASNYLSILAPSASATGIFFGNPTGANRGGILFNDASSLDGLIFRTGGNSTRMTITSAGNVGIGTTTPAAQLTTTGTVQFANFGAGSLQTDANGNLSVSSDERLKTLNGSFTRGLDAVLGLSPILYHWNATSKLDQATQYAGFSAQNVKASIPEAVDTDPRGYLTLSDRPILAASINAIKELNNKTITLGEYASTTGRTVEDLGLALDMIASTTIATTSSSTPGSIRFATSFWKNVFAKVSEWIGDSANGIKTVVAGQLRAKESICVDDQCLSKDDVRVLLEMARERGSAGVGASVNTPTPTPTPEPVSPAPTDDPSVVTPPTPVTETPAPTPTPEPQPAPTPEPVVTAPVSPTPEPVTASPVTVEATTPTAATPAI